MSKLDIAKAYKERSQILNMSITDIATKSGVARQTLYRIFKGENNTTQLQTLTKISNTLGLSLDYTLELYYLETSKSSKHNKNNPYKFLNKKSLDRKYSDLEELIDHKVEKKGINYTILAETMGTTRQTLHRIKTNKDIIKCKLDMLASLAKHLNLSIYNLLEVSGQKSLLPHNYIQTSKHLLINKLVGEEGIPTTSKVSTPYDRDTYRG